MSLKGLECQVSKSAIVTRAHAPRQGATPRRHLSRRRECENAAHLVPLLGAERRRLPAAGRRRALPERGNGQHAVQRVARAGLERPERGEEELVAEPV